LYDLKGELELDLVNTRSATRRERLTTVLKEYWDVVRKNQTFPVESVFDFKKVSDIWDSCFLVDANNQSREEDYFFKHIGRQIREAYQSELSNLQLDNIVNTHASHLSREFEKVLAMKIPIYYEGEINIDEDRTMKYRQILLPLGKDDINIKSIMGGFSYKIFYKTKK
jgi:hypothetical protein